MQQQSTAIDFERRFTCVKADKKSDPKTNSQIIAEQIAAFEKNGGHITQIPIGVSSQTPGKVIVGDSPESMATPRPNGAVKTVTAKNSEYITIAEAAELIGKSPSFINKRIRNGTLQPVKRNNTRAFFLERNAVLALITTNQG